MGFNLGFKGLNKTPSYSQQGHYEVIMTMAIFCNQNLITFMALPVSNTGTQSDHASNNYYPSESLITCTEQQNHD